MSGRICRWVTFDEDDLLGALDELEARHRVLAGDTYSDVEHVLAENVAATNRHDWTAYEAGMTPDLVATDHRIVGFGTLDRDGLLAWSRTREELIPNSTTVISKVYGDGPAILATGRATGVTADGNEYEWPRSDGVRARCRRPALPHRRLRRRPMARGGRPVRGDRVGWGACRPSCEPRPARFLRITRICLPQRWLVARD